MQLASFIVTALSFIRNNQGMPLSIIFPFIFTKLVLLAVIFNQSKLPKLRNAAGFLVCAFVVYLTIRFATTEFRLLQNYLANGNIVLLLISTAIVLECFFYRPSFLPQFFAAVITIAIFVWQVTNIISSFQMRAQFPAELHNYAMTSNSIGLVYTLIILAVCIIWGIRNFRLRKAVGI